MLIYDQVFLLLLCAGVQEKNTDILSAAVQLDPSFHWDIRQLIEAVVRPDDPTFLLPLNFADVFFQHSGEVEGYKIMISFTFTLLNFKEKVYK